MQSANLRCGFVALLIASLFPACSSLSNAEPPPEKATTVQTLSARNPEDFRSGPDAGSVIHTFFVRAVTGPHRNRSVCYVCRYGSRPVVMVLIQKVDPKLPSLLKALDKVVDRQRVAGLRSFGVLVTDESSRAVPILQTMAFDERIRMPLTAATTAIAGTGGHNLHPDSATTIVLYRNQRAVASLGFQEGKLDESAIEATLENVDVLLKADSVKSSK